ncbi:MAG: exodeoxyribonuclease VII large subunit [Bacteriovoracaceae bacterium]|nr:exodeoxyribonuclease VII large subunit [Bacteriovoracaceae bacterium]
MQALKVSDLVNQIKNNLESSFPAVLVEGEISNLSFSMAGHWYFNVSDEDACISCALFKMDALRNPLIKNLKDGDKIIISGPITVYQKRGTFQILVKKLITAGKGNLQQQFEMLKQKLSAEGLFDLNRKKKIPSFPRKLAIITALQGAALQDFLSVMKRRAFSYEILVVPAVVQGQQSAASIIKAINYVESRDDFEVLIFARGGGSIEDLWSFNDEKLVRRMAEIKIPTISAIGHQTDYTLSDFVCDLRCETPTAAAEILSQPQTEIQNKFYLIQKKLSLNFHYLRERFVSETRRYHPYNLLKLLEAKKQSMAQRFHAIPIRHKFYELTGLFAFMQRLDESYNSIVQSTSTQLQERSAQLEKMHSILHAVNPNNVLNRGYSYVVDNQNNVLTSYQSFTKLGEGVKLKIKFHDGEGHVQKSH